MVPSAAALPSSAGTALLAALRLPASDPRIAHWLFSNKHLTYHPDAPVLPPTAFASALSLHIAHNYTPSNLPGDPFALPFPPATATSAQSQTQPPTSTTMDMLLLPALTLPASATLGYTLTRAATTSPNLYPFAGDTPPPAMRGRFAIHPSGTHAIVVIHDMSPSATGLQITDCLPPSRLVRRFITVPNRHYSFEHLPDTVLAFAENEETRVPEQRPVPAPISRPSAPQDIFASSFPDLFVRSLPEDDRVDDASWAVTAPPALSGQGLPSLPADLFPEISEGVSSDPLSSLLEEHTPSTIPSSAASSDQPNEVSNSFDLLGTSVLTPPKTRGAVPSESDDLHVFKPGRSNASDGPFNMTSMATCLANLERSLDGLYFAPRLCRDIFDPVTGAVTLRTTGEMRARLTTSDVATKQLLVDITSHAYYASALSVSTDRYLTFPAQADTSAESEVVMSDLLDISGAPGLECDGQSANTTTLGLQVSSTPVFAPLRIAPARTIGIKDVVEQKQSPLSPDDEEAVRKAKLEAKRRYNRLSAAKSNQRKKERVAAQEKELTDLKARVQVLRDVEEKLAQENVDLKRRCGLGRQGDPA